MPLSSTWIFSSTSFKRRVFLHHSNGFLLYSQCQSKLIIIGIPSNTVWFHLLPPKFQVIISFMTFVLPPSNQIIINKLAYFLPQWNSAWNIPMADDKNKSLTFIWIWNGWFLVVFRRLYGVKWNVTSLFIAGLHGHMIMGSFQLYICFWMERKDCA